MTVCNKGHKWVNDFYSWREGGSIYLVTQIRYLSDFFLQNIHKLQNNNNNNKNNNNNNNDNKLQCIYNAQIVAAKKNILEKRATLSVTDLLSIDNR